MQPQSIQNGARLLAYNRQDAVAVGTSITLLDVVAPKATQSYGVSLGLGLSDVNGWQNVEFGIYVNGIKRLSFTDQLCSLLQTEFFPLEIKQNERVTIEFANNYTAALDVAAKMRIEAF